MAPATRNIYFGDITSDQVYVTRYQPSGSLPDIDKLVWTAENDDLNGYWSDNYRTIQRVNLLIDKIEDPSYLENERRIYIAEADFYGPYAYFNLVRVFGGVPLYDKAVDIDEIYDVPRSSERGPRPGDK